MDLFPSALKPMAFNKDLKNVYITPYNVKSLQKHAFIPNWAKVSLNNEDINFHPLI